MRDEASQEAREVSVMSKLDSCPSGAIQFFSPLTSPGLGWGASLLCSVVPVAVMFQLTPEGTIQHSRISWGRKEQTARWQPLPWKSHRLEPNIWQQLGGGNSAPVEDEMTHEKHTGEQCSLPQGQRSSFTRENHLWRRPEP